MFSIYISYFLYWENENKWLLNLWFLRTSEAQKELEVVCIKKILARNFIHFYRPSLCNRSLWSATTLATLAFMDWFIYKNKGSLFSLPFWGLWRCFHIWPCSTTITKTEFPKKVKSSQQMQPNRAEKKIIHV